MSRCCKPRDWRIKSTRAPEGALILGVSLLGGVWPEDKAYLPSGGSFRAVIVSLLTSDSFLYRK